MSQIEEIIRDNIGKILSGVGAVLLGVFGWIRFRRKDKAETVLSEADAELKIFTVKTLKDKYYEEREAKLLSKIDSLVERLEERDARYEALQKEMQADRILITELKSELTKYKTIRPIP